MVAILYFSIRQHTSPYCCDTTRVLREKINYNHGFATLKPRFKGGGKSNRNNEKFKYLLTLLS
jgi:hypothetical protein